MRSSVEPHSVLPRQKSPEVASQTASVVNAQQFSQSPRVHAVSLFDRGFQLHASAPTHAALHSVSPSQSEHSLPQQLASYFQASPSPIHVCEMAESVIVWPTSASVAFEEPPRTFFTVATTSSVTLVFAFSLLFRHRAMAAPDASDPVIAHRFVSVAVDQAQPSSIGVSFTVFAPAIRHLPDSHWSSLSQGCVDFME